MFARNQRARRVAVLTLLLCIALASTASAQNPFLQNRGQRTIGSITFHGQKVTKEYVLQRALGLEVGQTYDPVAVSDAWERLEQLPFIAYVDVQEKRPNPEEVHLAVYVEEDHRLVTLPVVNYMRRHDGYVLGGDLRFMNFRGRAETLRLTATWLNRHGYDLSWTNPHILGRAHLGVIVAGQWERYDFLFRPLRLRDSRVAVGAYRDLGRWVRASGGLEWRELGLDEAEAGEAEGIVQDSAAKLALTFDSRDLRFYPSKGVFAEVAGRFAGLGEEPYQILDASAAAFVNVPFIDILAGSIRARQVSESVPFYELSYLGGPNDVRGFDYGSIRGEEHLIASLEIRRPVFLLALREGRAVGLGVHAFHDWGKAWSHDTAFDGAPLYWSRGLGLHVNFNTKNLRFEWARTDDGDNAFVFEDEFTF